MTDNNLQTTETNELETTRGSSEHRTVKPTVDIYESSDELLVLADVPGVRSENMDIRLKNNVLPFEARWTQSEHRSPEHREFNAVNYLRTFRLSQGIDRDNIKAELNNGVLTLHLPKLAGQGPRQIPITT